MSFYILYLFEKIFCFSYRRKIIDKQHFQYIFNSPFRYIGGVPLMTLIHLLLFSSLVWIYYCTYVYILYLLEKIFCYSYRHKIIDIQHFPYIFNGPFQYLGGVTLMNLNHLQLTSSRVQILYRMNVYILYLYRKILRNPFCPSIFPLFLIVHFGISVSWVIIKAGSKFGQSNNNAKLAPIGMKFGT